MGYRIVHTYRYKIPVRVTSRKQLKVQKRPRLQSTLVQIPANTVTPVNLATLSTWSVKMIKKYLSESQLNTFGVRATLATRVYRHLTHTLTSPNPPSTPCRTSPSEQSEQSEPRPRTHPLAPGTCRGQGAGHHRLK